jgi:hypothetical protein
VHKKFLISGRQRQAIVRFEWGATTAISVLIFVLAGPRQSAMELFLRLRNVFTAAGEALIDET